MEDSRTYEIMDNKAIFQEYIVPEWDAVLHFRLWQSMVV
jgi:hypothetical protein